MCGYGYGYAYGYIVGGVNINRIIFTSSDNFIIISSDNYIITGVN